MDLRHAAPSRLQDRERPAPADDYRLGAVQRYPRGQIKGANDLNREHRAKYGTGEYAPIVGVAYWIHGLTIVAAPAKLSGGMLDHYSLLAEGAELRAGGSETLSANLKPGRYELVCHLPGHYAAGQHIPFAVE